MAKKATTLKTQLYNDLKKIIAAEQREEKKAIANQRAFEKLLLKDFKEQEKKHSSRNKSKPREKLYTGKSTRKKVLNPRTGETFWAAKTKMPIKTGFIETPDAMSTKIMSLKDKLEAKIKATCEKGDSVAIGYEFTFNFDKTKWDKNLINQTGYTERFTVGSNKAKDMNNVLTEIANQFAQNYYTKNHIRSLKIENFIIEKIKGEKTKTRKGKTGISDFEIKKAKK